MSASISLLCLALEVTSACTREPCSQLQFCCSALRFLIGFSWNPLSSLGPRPQPMSAHTLSRTLFEHGYGIKGGGGRHTEAALLASTGSCEALGLRPATWCLCMLWGGGRKGELRPGLRSALSPSAHLPHPLFKNFVIAEAGRFSLVHPGPVHFSIGLSMAVLCMAVLCLVFMYFFATIGPKHRTATDEDYPPLCGHECCTLWTMD